MCGAKIIITHESVSARAALCQMCARTCRHIKEEGEDAPSVVASPQDPPRSIKGKRQHAACQLTGAPFNLLPSGDVHHLQVMLAVSYLQITTGGEERTLFTSERHLKIKNNYKLHRRNTLR